MNVELRSLIIESLSQKAMTTPELLKAVNTTCKENTNSSDCHREYGKFHVFHTCKELETYGTLERVPGMGIRGGMGWKLR